MVAVASVACRETPEWSEEKEAPYVVERDSPLGPNPPTVYRGAGRNQCSNEIAESRALSALRGAENVAIASLRVLEECSSLGGNHVFASTERVIRGVPAKALQAGGHGCPTFTVGESRPFVSFDAWAVVSYQATNEEPLDGGEAWCIPPRRDGTLDVIVIFDGRAKAEAFARRI